MCARACDCTQVHAATLLDGRKVAVKVQRPNCEPKLRGDIANLKSFSKKLASALPVDYYTVFCELEVCTLPPHRPLVCPPLLTTPCGLLRAGGVRG